MGEGLKEVVRRLADKGKDIEIDLRGIVYREGDAWISHCLELDIVAEGRTPKDATKNALDLCVFQISTAIENSDLESVFRPAPARFWNLFYSGIPKKKLPSTHRLPVRRFEAREVVCAE